MWNRLKASHIDWADMVFVTAMVVQKDSLRQIAQRCRAKGKRVVLGGPYVTTTVEDLPDADHIFLGEAETTLQQFVQDLTRGEGKWAYQSNERPSLAATPPHFHLANLETLQRNIGAVLARLPVFLRVLRHHRNVIDMPKGGLDLTGTPKLVVHERVIAKLI